MKTDAILFASPEEISTCQVEVPEPGPNEIMTETIVSAISPGTEIRMLHGHYGTEGKFPFVPGYNAIGRVIRVGSKAAGWREGDLVSTINPTPFPGTTCLYGGHARIQVHPVDIDQRPIPLPEVEDPARYALVELGAISLRGVMAVKPRRGENAVVIGQGLIGLLSAVWLKQHGCRVTVVDRSEHRLQRSRALGVDHVLSAGEPDIFECLQSRSREGFDIVVEASGSTPGAKLATKIIRRTPTMPTGRYVREPISLHTDSWPRLVFQANYLEPFPFNPHGDLSGEGVVVIAAGDRGIDERMRCAQAIRWGELPDSLVEKFFAWNDAPAAYGQLKDLQIHSAVLKW